MSASRSNRPSEARAAGWVFLAALAVHALIAWQYRSDPFLASPISDALSYQQWAMRLADGGLSAEPVFHQAPLYPVQLGLLHAATARPEAAIRWAIAIQAVLSSLAIALLVPLGRLSFGSRSAGVAAACLALGHGPLVFHALKLVPVTLAVFTQAVMLWALLRARDDTARGRHVAAAGVALGIAALARSEALLFLPVAAVTLALAWRTRGPGRSLLIFGTAVAVTILPATLHNVSRGDLVLIASSAGENLYIGNQRGADGGHTPLHPQAGDLFSQRELATRIAEEARGGSLRPSEASAYWRGRAIEEIAADPAGWLSLVGRKLGRLLAPGDPTDMYAIDLERRHYLTALYPLFVSPWALLALGLPGAVLALRRTRGASAPLLTLLVIHVGVLLAFFVSTRLRLPFYFFLTLPAGLSLVGLLASLRTPRARRPAGAAVVGLVALCVHGTIASRADVREELRLASVLSMQGRLDESLAVLAPRLGGDHPDGSCLDQAAFVHAKRGELDVAIELYRRALRANLPDWRVPQTRTRLALALERSGALEDARSEFDRAVADPAAGAGTWFERAGFRRRHGDRDGAVADLRRAATLQPDWPAPREALQAIGAEVPPRPQ